MGQVHGFVAGLRLPADRLREGDRGTFVTSEGGGGGSEDEDR